MGVTGVVRKTRARVRERGAPTHVATLALRPTPVQRSNADKRLDAGRRVFNAVLGECFRRRNAMVTDPAYLTARSLPVGKTGAGSTIEQRAVKKARTEAFKAVQDAHGFTESAVMSFASSLRVAWVREHVGAQQAQALGRQAFRAVADWHYRGKGKPRFKSVRRGMRSMTTKDTLGNMRPVLTGGVIIAVRWGTDVIAVHSPSGNSRKARETRAELERVSAAVANGGLLSTRIVRTPVKGTTTLRAHLTLDGHPPVRHERGTGRVRLDVGPQVLAWTTFEQDSPAGVPHLSLLADGIENIQARLRREQRRLDRQHRAGSPDCFHPDGTHIRNGCHWGRSVRKSGHATATQVRVADLHARVTGHRKTLHGQLANQILTHGVDVATEKIAYTSWVKTFPRSMRDRAPGGFIDRLRRKAESADGGTFYEFSTYTTALSQTCVCGARQRKPLWQRVHRCQCGITAHRDVFSSFLADHVHPDNGVDRLDLVGAAQAVGLLHDIEDARGPAFTTKRRGRGPASRRSMARIKARRKAKAAKRQSRSSAGTTHPTPTATPATHGVETA